MTDKKIVLDTLGTIQKYFGKVLVDEVLEIYIERLAKLDEKDFKAASVRIMDGFSPTSTNPFPLIKDFLEAVGLDGRSRAVNIVSVVRHKIEELGQYESADFGDPALHSVIKRYGGWVEMVLNNTDQWWSLHERNFISAYESALKSGFGGPKRLKGLHEIDNSQAGFTPDILEAKGIKPRICGFDDEVKRISE